MMLMCVRTVLTVTTELNFLTAASRSWDTKLAATPATSDIITNPQYSNVEPSLKTSAHTYPERGTSSHLPTVHLERTLRFRVCNGFANQRLAILYAALIAKKTSRTLVLPALVGLGTQLDDNTVLENQENSVSFESMYDADTFITAMREMGMGAVPQALAPPLSSYTQLSLAQVGMSGLQLLEGHNSDPHVSLDCTLFKVPPTSMNSDNDLTFMWAVLEGLVPNQHHQSVIKQAAAALHKIHMSNMSNSRGQPIRQSNQTRHVYNVLHLRIEDDWLFHCNRWSNIKDGIVRDNCYNNTDTIHEYLQAINISPDVPLYVAAYWPGVSTERAQHALKALSGAGYKVVTSRDLANILSTSNAWEAQREMGALLDYGLAKDCVRFCGNSVSTFSALAILERRHAGQWAAYYNGGNMPLTTMLPGLHQMPWVFTANSWSEPYDYMIKAAVKSSIRHGGFKPYCLFSGRKNSNIYRWLAFHNVTLLQHKPAWREQLLEVAKSKMKENVRFSPLYKSANMLVSTCQRLDVSRMPLLDQYTYVLYTDADVYFRRRITLNDFSLPLPMSVGMASETPGVPGGNAGVMLMHLPRLRTTYTKFIEFILSNKQGLHFGQYGPADQGAFNEFYKDEMPPHPLSQVFNTRPFGVVLHDASIVHFHGPKPAGYLQYVHNGRCGNLGPQYNELCENAFTSGGLCTFAPEWGLYLTFETTPTIQEPVNIGGHNKEDALAATSHDPSRVAHDLMAVCSWLSNREAPTVWREDGIGVTPTMLQLHNKKWRSKSDTALA